MIQALGRVVPWALACLALAGGCARTPLAPGAEPPAPERAAAIVAPLASFESAKRIAWEIYRDHPLTLYCSCPYDEARRIEREDCGYVPRKPGVRAERVEWEHVVPALAFGGHRACWRQKSCKDSRGRPFGGRRCCRKLDPEFSTMEADLHNLAPEIGELNGDRSSFSFAEVDGEPRAYGACDFEVWRALRVAEPAPSTRGDIARAYLYMLQRYGRRALPLAPAQLSMLQRWHASDPPSEWERVRNARIRDKVGSNNPFVEEAVE